MLMSASLLWFRILFAKMLFRDELKRIAELPSADAIRTFSFKPGDHQCDPFWGAFINQFQERPLIIVTELNYSLFRYKKRSDKLHSRHIEIPYFALCQPLDLIQSLGRLLKEFLSDQKFCHQSTEFADSALFFFKKELITPAALTSLLFYEGFQRLFNQVEIKRCFILFENNPWEKMIHLAAKSQPLHRRPTIIGYQHASIQPGALNYRVSKYEIQQGLIPHRIVCASAFTHQLLQQYLPTMKSKILDGCALRYPFQLPSSEAPFRSKNPRKILITLDGFPESIQLAEFILNFMQTDHSSSEFQFTFREHPNFKFTQGKYLAIKTKLLEFKNIRFSIGTLLEDFQQNMILVYSGSTTCIEALTHGLQLIQFPIGFFEFDPLASFPQYRIRVTSSQEMQRALTEIQSLSQQELQARQEKGRQLALSYFISPTEEKILEMARIMTPDENQNHGQLQRPNIHDFLSESKLEN